MLSDFFRAIKRKCCGLNISVAMVPQHIRSNVGSDTHLLLVSPLSLMLTRINRVLFCTRGHIVAAIACLLTRAVVKKHRLDLNWMIGAVQKNANEHNPEKATDHVYRLQEEILIGSNFGSVVQALI